MMDVERWYGVLRWLAVSVPLLVQLQVNAQSQTPHTVMNHAASLPKEIATALAAADIDVQELSMVISPLDGAADLVNHLGQVARVPASTQKLITTAIGLDVLGADFYWQNTVYLRGLLLHGTLYGDVLIRGSGDPALTHERLDALMATLAKRAPYITGDIIIDDTLFYQVGYDANAFDGQGWRAYNAEPSAFLVNFGTLEFKFAGSGRYALMPKPVLAMTDSQATEQSTQHEQVVSTAVQTNAAKHTTVNFIPDHHADQALVQIFPKLDNFALQNIIVAEHGHCSLPRVTFDKQAAQLTGGFGVDCGTQSLWRNFGDNRLLAIKAVHAAYRAAGGRMDGVVRMIEDKEVRQGFQRLALINQPSLPLSEQIARINQYSNNVMTEQMALSLPIYAAGVATSSYAQSHAFINQWWQQNLSTTPPIISRASGLCRDCRISAVAMISLLKYMHAHPDFSVFLSSLPVAGKTGTMASLAQRSPNHPAIDRAWIKTGTLNDVVSMAGYVQGVSGRWYAVVGFVNAKDAGYSPKAVAVLDAMLAWAATH